MRKITTIPDLVEAFGGPSKLAAWAFVRPSAVSNWIERGAIPAGLHMRLYREGQQRGLDIDDDVFGIRHFPTDRNGGVAIAGDLSRLDIDN